MDQSTQQDPNVKARASDDKGRLSFRADLLECRQGQRAVIGRVELLVRIHDIQQMVIHRRFSAGVTSAGQGSWTLVMRWPFRCTLSRILELTP